MREEITGAQISLNGALSEEQRIRLIGALLCKGIQQSPWLRSNEDGPSAAVLASEDEPEQRIVNYLKRHQTASPSEMQAVLNLSRSRTYRALQQLLLSRQIAANGGRTTAASYRLVTFAASGNNPESPKINSIEPIAATVRLAASNVGRMRIGV